ncbi:MAG TPA: sugar phosphate isomerase/epimerase [Actinomycetota bacterium]|nr:sugar phosphate isomerase/epimerase [Actinomycetota bacterium]
MDVGIDSLCWHMRLASGAVSIDDVLDATAALGAPVLAVNMPHVADRDVDGLAELADRASGLGVRLLAQGDFVGSARRGDEPSAGAERVRGWVERATALRSPTLRVASGFYRADLAGRPALIDAERRYVTAVLTEAAPAAVAAGVRIVLENHSDFTVDEYETIVADVGVDRMGVWLDLINPLVTFDDPFRAIVTLAPHASSGHVRDFELRSIQQPDGYHRRGFEVLYRYPGEGVAPLSELVTALVTAVGDRPYDLLIEGLDSVADVDDQEGRLSKALPFVRRLVEDAGST